MSCALRLTGPEGLGRLSEGTRVAAERPHRFRATLHTAHIGAIRMDRLRTSAVSVTRDRQPETDAHCGRVAMVVVRSGEAHIEQQHRCWQVGRGELGFVDFDLPFHVRLSGRGDYLTAHLPHATLAARSVEVRTLAGHAVAEPLVGMLAAVLAEATATDLHEGTRTEHALVEHALVDLCVAVIRSALRRVPARDVLGVQNRSRAVEFVENHFSDPTLNVTRVAAALNVSPRYLHRLFEGEEHSVYELIRRRRVAQGLDLLMDPAHAHLSIGQIAARSGFVGPSQFGRAVRQITGSTPRAVRMRESG